MTIRPEFKAQRCDAGSFHAASAAEKEDAAPAAP
jgi:hypothetical protein